MTPEVAALVGELRGGLAELQAAVARSLEWRDHRAAHIETCGPCRQEARAATEYGFGPEHLEHCYIVQARDEAATLAKALNALPALLDALDAAEQEADERLAQVLYTRKERDAANRLLEQANGELDAALAMSERYRDHEFTRPLDAQGCCAVCHQPLDFEAHRPASLTSALASLRAEAEQLHVQLAGCSVAAFGWAAGDCEQGAYGWSVPFDDVKKLRAQADRMRGAIRDALNELGVPGDGYPMPVANAHVILSEAIADATQPRALLADPAVERLGG